jgi:hypothetical protein
MTNPFAEDEEADNPFAGPSDSVTSSPFSAAPPPAASPPSYSEPEPIPHQAPAAAAATPGTKVGPIALTLGPGDYRDPVTGMVLTKAQMDQRERELAKRETEIAGFETQVSNGTFVRSKEKNFPPYFHWWSWHPDRDLAEAIAPAVKKLFWLFLGCTAVYAWNVIGCLSLLNPDAAQNIRSPATHIVLSLVFFIVLCPLSFELAFFTLYKAIERAKAIKFFCGLFVYVVWCGVLVFNLIGIKSGGSVGFIVMIDVFGGNSAVGVIALIFCILGSAVAAAQVYSILWLVRYYRANGLAEKAIGEGATLAAQYARDHPEQAIAAAGYAQEHPDQAMAVAGYAASGA